MPLKMLTCTGPLPVVLVISDVLVLHIAGCTSTEEANTTLVLTADDAKKGYTTMSTPQGFRKRTQPSRYAIPPFAISANGFVCTKKWLHHAIRADCGPGVKQGVNTLEIRAHLLSSWAASPRGFAPSPPANARSSRVRLPLHLTSWAAQRVHCCTSVVHGNISLEAARLSRVRRAWDAVGFGLSVVFANTHAACAELVAAAPGSVHCEVRALHGAHPLHGTEHTAFPHIFLQNLWHQVCLVYGRAIPPARRQLGAPPASPLLALTDLDEVPPPNLETAILSTMDYRARRVGVRVLFDHRVLHNVMVHESGALFHIDFGFLLGDQTMLEARPRLAGPRPREKKAAPHTGWGEEGER